MMIGETLGPYRVLGKPGEGGMGEVCRARDPKLNRDVAIKILPEALVADPAALASVFSPLRLVRYPIGVGASVPVDHGSLERVGSAGWKDETHTWICGNEKGRTARCYVQDIAEGPLKTLTPEGLDFALVSPDGKLVEVSSGRVPPGSRDVVCRGRLPLGDDERAMLLGTLPRGRDT